MASSGEVITKVGPCGGDGGEPRDMNINGISRIVKISVRHRFVIEALTVRFVRHGREESSEQWGGQGGSLTEFILQPTEYITSVKGHYGNHNGLFVVKSLKFETNLGTFGPYGTKEGISFELPAFNGQIIGFHGRSGLYLDSLGVYTKGIHPMDRLKAGFQQFKTEVYDKKPELFGPLKEGQWPKYMLFACCDSRVSPSVTLSLLPGEAFTVRNIANIVPPFNKIKYTSAGSALEYAVEHLHVENIVVIGHSKCGGIKALMTYKFDGSSGTEFIEDWMKIGFAAREKVLAEHGSKPLDVQCAICEKEAVKLSLENLKTYPFVKEALENGTLKLFGAHYDFIDGAFKTLK